MQVVSKGAIVVAVLLHPLVGSSIVFGQDSRGGWLDEEWTYIYEARLGEDVAGVLGAFDDLDGTWDDDNLFSNWFGDNLQNTAYPAGVEALTRPGLGDNEGGTASDDAESLGIYDLGETQNNNRIYFERFLTDGGDTGEGAPIIDFADGLTIVARFRFFSADDLLNMDPAVRASDLGIPAVPSEDAAILALQDATNTLNAGTNEYDEGPREMEGSPNGMFMVSRGDVFAGLGGGAGGLYWGMNMDGDDSWDPSTFADPPAALPPVGVKVALIVGAPNDANATFQMSDGRIVDRLRARGIEVTVLDDEQDNAYTNGSLTGPAAVAADHDLVMISSTVFSGYVEQPDDHYKPYDVPLLIWESALGVPSKGYSIASDGGLVFETTDITITNTTHPITAGLATGDQTIIAGSAERRISVIGYSIPSAGTSLAHLPGNTSLHALVAYDPDKGGTLVDGSSLLPNQRWVFLPMEDDTFWALNGTGLQVFDAAVEWALGPTKAALLGPRPPVPPPPPAPEDYTPSFYINLGATPAVEALGQTLETRVLKGRFFRDTSSSDPAVPAIGGDTKVWADLPTGSMNDFLSVWITVEPEDPDPATPLPTHRVKVYFNGCRGGEEPVIEIQNHHLDPAIVPAIGTGTPEEPDPNDGTGLSMGLWRPRAAGYLDVDYFGVLAGAVPPTLAGYDDLNNDGKVDDQDIELFEGCASGPGVPYEDPSCLCADMDGDGDIDQNDFGELQKAYAP